jgi:hypothetical protein
MSQPGSNLGFHSTAQEVVDLFPENVKDRICELRTRPRFLTLF